MKTRKGNLMDKKLSELIREGAKKHPQIFGSLMVTSDILENSKHPLKLIEGTCAIGAAWVAADPSFQFSSHMEALDLYGIYDNIPRSQVPSCLKNKRILTGPSTPITSIIVNLNDGEHWTREQIAD